MADRPEEVTTMSRALWKETFIQANGMPRTKGIQNAFVPAANAPKGGPMGDKRTKRQGSRSQQEQRAIREHE